MINGSFFGALFLDPHQLWRFCPVDGAPFVISCTDFCFACSLLHISIKKIFFLSNKNGSVETLRKTVKNELFLRMSQEYRFRSFLMVWVCFNKKMFTHIPLSYWDPLRTPLLLSSIFSPLKDVMYTSYFFKKLKLHCSIGKVE